jgi:hypothetical protein
MFVDAERDFFGGGRECIQKYDGAETMKLGELQFLELNLHVDNDFGRSSRHGTQFSV